VRVLDVPPSSALPKRPTLDEFNRPSGLTPLDNDMEVPSLAQTRPPRKLEPRRKSDPVISDDSRPPGVRSKRRSQAMAAVSPPAPPPIPRAPPRDTHRQRVPPRMRFAPSSRPLITPTPLPPPVASHDHDEEDSVVTNPAARAVPVRPRMPPVPPPPPLRTPTGELPRGVRGTAPPSRREDVDDEALTTVAPESGWRPPSRQMRAEPEPVMSDPEPIGDYLDEENIPPEPEPEEEVTPPRGIAPVGGNVFDEATRFGDSLAEVGPAAMRPAPPPEPPKRPKRITRNTLRMGSKPQRATIDDSRQTDPRVETEEPVERQTDPMLERRRLPGVGVGRPTVELPAARGKVVSRSFDEDEDDATRVDDGLPSMMMMKPRFEDIEIVGDEDIELPRAFDRTFSEALQGLAPDGSAIDTPLTMFSELPEEALNELVRRMSLRSFRSGEVVLREGDAGDACFVIASGSVRVLKRDPSNESSELIEVARLGSGAVFGEFALLADRRRHATVQAVEACELYEIPRRLLRELAATYSEVGPALERFYRERLLSTLLATAPFFQPLAEDRRGELLARFRPKRVESGQTVIREGERAGGLYLIVLGSVEIAKRVDAHRTVLLTTLGEGAYFGELSLMRGSGAQATVTANGPTELAVLPPEAFYEVVSANPVLWEEIRREAHRRELMLRQIVTGETNVV
jgi:CRP-like cAMP-binding protein